MPDTPNLALPLIAAGQAQKHITHNEALTTLDALVQLSVVSRDIIAPPVAPEEGERYIVPASATGGWSGWDASLAVFEAGAWRRVVPAAGFIAWVADEALHLRFDGAAWGQFEAFATSLPQLGINASADGVNRLAVSAQAALFSHAGANMRVVVNKQAAGDTASVLYQTGFSGRAEIGLTGSDDFQFKVSGDGVTWHDAITLTGTGGHVAMARLAAGGSLGNDIRSGRILALELAKVKDSVVELDVGIADGFASADNVNAAASLNETYVAAGQYYAPSAPGGVFADLLLRGTAHSLGFTPAFGQLLLLVKENSPVTVNTDLLARLSRDGGGTFSLASLVFVRERADGLKLYEALWIDLTSQPAGGNLVWQVETANAKNIEIHGVVAQG